MSIETISVAQITDYIKEQLEDDPFLQNIWVIGEVTSVNHNYNFGLFFTLKEGEKALECIIWQNNIPKLYQQPLLGQQVVVLGKMSIYPKQSKYRLAVVQVLAAGEGLEAQLYQKLKERLTKEGLFDRARKRPIPEYPQTIAVVTSPTAAAWGDLQRTISQRAPGTQILFSPATVQGKSAPQSIVKALERIERDDRAELIILARGGGSKDDLDCFNDEQVVRAIARCRRPVITGIGHDRDESLADLVADGRAHTPTAAAELAVPNYPYLWQEHQQRRNHLARVLQQRLHQEKITLQNRHDSLAKALQQRIEWEGKQLARLKEQLRQIPDRARSWQQAIKRYEILREKLTALNPEAVLKRGYTLTRLADGSLARDSHNVTPGSELIVQLSQGKIKVKVMEILE